MASHKSLKTKRLPLAQRVDQLEDSMRDQVITSLRQCALVIGLQDDRIAVLEARVAALESRDETAGRLAAAGLVAPVIGRA